MNIVNGKYPVIGTEPQEYIPHEVLIPHEKRAIENHGQTLKRLAERGGLCWMEILFILEDKPFSCKEYDKLSNDAVKNKVWRHVLKFYNYTAE